MSHFTLNGTPPNVGRALTLAREVASAARTLSDLNTAPAIRRHTDFLAARRRALRTLLSSLDDATLAAWREWSSAEAGTALDELGGAVAKVALERKRLRNPSTFLVADARTRDAEHYRRGR